MYNIIKNDVSVAILDNLISVKLNRNNIYIPCDFIDAEGIVIDNDYVEPIEGLKIRYIDGAASINTMLPELTNKTASGFVALYPTLKYDNSLIKAGTRINWNGWLKQATVDLWDTEANDPDHAPTLWVKIQYKDGARVIPDVISAAEAFDKDELGWWDGAIYKSLIAANVYTPDAYPQGWELQE